VAGLLAIGLFSAAAQAAAGDTCPEALDVGALPFSGGGTTCGAGNDFTNDVGGLSICPDLPRGYGGEDVYYKLTLQQGNRVAFDLTMPPGASGDLALFLVRAQDCASALVCAGNSVDLIGAGAGPERIKANAQSYPSGTYYLIVDSALPTPDPASCGAYTLAITGHLSEFCGNGVVDTGELCDDGDTIDDDCCAADCKTKAPAGKPCRGPQGMCDIVETCNADGACPVDLVKAAGSPCRPSAGRCDVPEFCQGLGPQCPADRFAGAGTVCGPARNLCDETELCPGNSAACPADRSKPVGTVCGTGTLCREAPTCGAGEICLMGTPVSCDDGNACTVDSCDPIFACVHRPACMDAGVADGSVDSAPADASSADLAAAIPDVPRDLPAMDVLPVDLSMAGPDLAAPAVRDGREAPIGDPTDAALPPGDGSTDTSSVDTAGLDTALGPLGFDAATFVTPLDAGARDGAVTEVSSLSGSGRAGLLPGDAFAGSGSSGCGCRLGGGKIDGDTSWSSVVALGLLGILALRRRRT
jgi:cysteine-rich repeat protein